MANMSYCRFENTANDLSDCLGAIEEAIENGMTMEQFKKSLSDYELNGFHRLMSTIQAIQDSVVELDEAEGFEVDEVE